MESIYWKEFLVSTASELKKVKRPKPLTLRRLEIIERDIALSFFILRKLIELHKVSKKIRDYPFKVFLWPCTEKLSTLLNNHKIEELYDFSKEQPQTKKPIYICHQIIHSYTSGMIVDETRNWDSLLVVSDYDRRKNIWRIPIVSIVGLLKEASEDYPNYMAYKWNNRTGDYDVITN